MPLDHFPEATRLFSTMENTRAPAIFLTRRRTQNIAADYAKAFKAGGKGSGLHYSPIWAVLKQTALQISRLRREKIQSESNSAKSG